MAVLSTSNLAPAGTTGVVSIHSSLARRIYGYTMLAELPFRLREALKNHPALREVEDADCG
jgi:hypothetical protein